MAGTLVATVNCNRNQLTTLLVPLVANKIYAVENASQGDDQVQYWGTLFQQVDDTSESRYPYEVVDTVQLYRRAYRFFSQSYSATFVGRATIWIPRQYRFTFAIIRVFLLN